MIRTTERDQVPEDREQAGLYDDAAQKTGWQGPSLVFDLLSRYTRPGQTLLDIGIGTGLGSEPFSHAGLHVRGMDLSESMLEICRRKGFAERLVRHDLAATPYPFGDASIDHIISTGVFQFFSDLDSVFSEVGRILPGGGMFAFITGDRSPEENPDIIAGPEQTGTDESVTLFLHTPEQVACWLEKNGFRLESSEQFTIWMDERHTKELPARAYLAQKRE